VQRLLPVLVLLGAGAAWGLTLPLMRVAVSSGYRPLALIVWSNAIMAVLLAVLLAAMRLPRPAVRRNLDVIAAVAVFGSVLPGYFGFLTAGLLPAGVRAIVIALVPMFVLPMALAIGFERPEARRALGVLLGAGAIVLIVGPEPGGGGAVALVPVLLTMVAPLSYAVEANWLAWRGSHGLHPFQLLLGATLVSVGLAWPLAEVTGQMAFPVGWGPAEQAAVAMSVLNMLAYSAYVWLVGRAGSVFASQVAYLVTGFGVVWSKLLLGERYPASVWGALFLMLVGIALIQPRRRDAKEA
jgi:drug/metabolite transporter (DMT)-like permease